MKMTPVEETIMAEEVFMVEEAITKGRKQFTQIITIMLNKTSLLPLIRIFQQDHNLTRKTMKSIINPTTDKADQVGQMKIKMIGMIRMKRAMIGLTKVKKDLSVCTLISLPILRCQMFGKSAANKEKSRCNLGKR